MKNYAKIGGRKGKPAYRTGAKFRLIKIESIIRRKADMLKKKARYREDGEYQ